MKHHMRFAAVLLAASSVFAEYPYIQNQNRIAQLKTITLFPIESQYAHLTCGGSRQYDFSQSLTLRETLNKAVHSTLKTDSLNCFELSKESEEYRNWENICDMVNTVNSAVNSPFWGRTPPFTYRTPFDLSIGTIEPLCRKTGSDAVLIIWGVDEKETDERRKMRTAAIAGSTAMAFVGALAGVSTTIAVPRDEAVVLYAALVDQSGSILYLNRYIGGRDIDLTVDAAAQTAVNHLIGRVK